MKDRIASLRTALSEAPPWVVVLWLVFQCVLPAALLVTPRRPHPFGWQMYSATRPTPEFILEWSDRSSSLDIYALLARRRGEIDYARHIPAHMCRQDPTLRAVTIIERSKSPMRVPCP